MIQSVFSLFEKYIFSWNKRFIISLQPHPQSQRLPNLPNFSRIAAKIIEPNTGASTWALGSHKWTPYIGNLTTKAANKQKRQERGFVVHF